MKLLSLLIFTSVNLAYGVMPTNQKDCESQGMEWTEAQGCSVSDLTVQARESAEKCIGLEDTELEACTAAVAQEAAEDTEDYRTAHRNQGNNIALTASFIASVGTGYALLTGPRTCTQPSYWLLLGGSVSALTGEIIARARYNRLIGKAKEEYESQGSDDVTSLNARDSVRLKQLEAFKKLIAIEDARLRAERTRQTLYTVSMVAYTAASVSAILEIWNPLGEAGCAVGYSLPVTPPGQAFAILDSANVNNDPDRNHEIKETLGRLQNMVVSLFIESAHAKGGFVTGVVNPLTSIIKPLGLKPAVLPAINTAKTVTGQAVRSAVTRAALAVVLGTGAGLLMNQAKANKEIAKGRISDLERMKNEFEQIGSIRPDICTEASRRNPEQPQCFCYLADGAKDTSKSSMTICLNIWGKGYVPNAGNYDGYESNAYTGSGNTCINKQMNADLGCKCRQTNNCMNVLPSNLNFGKGFSWTQPILSSVNDSFDGGFESADYKNNLSENNAFALKKKQDGLLNEPKNKKYKAQISNLTAKLGNRFSELGKQAMASGGMGGLGSNLGSDSPTPNEKDKPAQNFRKKLLASVKSAVPAGKAKALDFDFDMGGGAEQGGVEVVDSAPEVEYDYKPTLHEDKDENLFEIISKRYKQSGVNKLFK